MNAFRFPLQKVLEVREETERRSVKELADARREADDATRAKEDLQAVRVASQTRIAKAHGAGGAVGHLQNLTYVIRRVEEQIHAADVACREAEEHVVDRLRTYHSALQDRKVIDQLRERRLDQWRSDVARHEQQTMDEVALTRYGRAAAESSRLE